MKQLIVMIAMIILGIAVGALIISFSSTAQTMKDKTEERINGTFDGWLSGSCAVYETL